MANGEHRPLVLRMVTTSRLTLKSVAPPFFSRSRSSASLFAFLRVKEFVEDAAVIGDAPIGGERKYRSGLVQARWKKSECLTERPECVDLNVLISFSP